MESFSVYWASKPGRTTEHAPTPSFICHYRLSPALVSPLHHLHPSHFYASLRTNWTFRFRTDSVLYAFLKTSLLSSSLSCPVLALAVLLLRVEVFVFSVALQGDAAVGEVWPRQAVPGFISSWRTGAIQGKAPGFLINILSLLFSYSQPGAAADLALSPRKTCFPQRVSTWNRRKEDFIFLVSRDIKTWYLLSATRA